MAEGGESAVRAAFEAQARWCEALGSPFTARLCSALASRLDRGSAIGRRILDWRGNPDAAHDSVPLRLAGGLHALVRRGRVPDLAALYPPNPLPGPDMLWAAVAAALRDGEAELALFLDGPPQTNEVARSAALTAGLAVVAAETGLPLALHELGASAGLNLLLDRYAVRLGGRLYGDRHSAVALAPSWSGGEPPSASITITSRRGVDLDPPDPRDPGDRERLTAFIWADQAERLHRMEAALAIAEAEPPSVDRADAADWIEAELERTPQPGVCRVVLHSVAFQYFPEGTSARIAAWIADAGARAEREAPVAWLRYESDPLLEGRTSLRLRLWPGGADRLLALADPHGRAIEWMG